MIVHRRTISRQGGQIPSLLRPVTRARWTLRRWADRVMDERVERAVARRAPQLQHSVDATVDRLAKSLAEIERDLFPVRHLLATGRRGNRTITEPQLERLYQQVRTVTGVQRLAGYGRQTYRSLIELELRGVGRIAGSTSNVLGKLMTTPLLAPPPGPVLEIGTLYGIFAGGLLRQFRRLGDARHVTVVDPLVGVQLQPGSMGGGDLSGSPVVPELVLANLRLSGADDDEFRLIQGYSTDPDTRAAAGDRSYAVVIVDGDHSEQGVYEDLRWVAGCCVDGAIVVLDDFDDPGWPGVRTGFERVCADGASFTLIGTVSTSAYLRFEASAGDHHPRRSP